jgi:hypothetical protein
MNPLFDYFENLSTNCLQNNNLLLNYDYEPIINDINDLSELNNLFFEPNNSNNNTNELPKNIISSQNTNSPEINQIIRPKTKLLGRKKKNSGEIGKHDKYAENNMIRKMKVIIKNDLLDFINSKIKNELNLSNIIINGKIYKENEIKLLNIKQDQIKDTNVDFNLTFLNTKIKDILSEKISKNNRIKYPSNFNDILINKIYQIENGESITSILDMTFLECLKFYRKDEDIINDAKYSCLKGLEKGFENLKDKLMKKNDEKYADMLIELIKKFEKVYFDKKSRVKRVNKNKLIIEISN